MSQSSSDTVDIDIESMSESMVSRSPLRGEPGVEKVTVGDHAGEGALAFLPFPLPLPFPLGGFALSGLPLAYQSFFLRFDPSIELDESEPSCLRLKWASCSFKSSLTTAESCSASFSDLWDPFAICWAIRDLTSWSYLNASCALWRLAKEHTLLQ